MRRGGSATPWRGVRAPQRTLADRLRQRHRLWLHGGCIGAFTLLLMAAVAHAQRALGVDSLALRYLATLGVGYLAYLLVLRCWAAWLLRRQGGEEGDGAIDAAMDLAEAVQPPSPGPAMRTGGGDFGGAGASGDWPGAAMDAGDAASEAAGLGDWAAGTLEAAAGADEGAVVVVPVVALFLGALAVVAGAGALAWLLFGWEVLLAVAVEVAFSVAGARAVMGLERVGWLSAAVRLTWKPLLAALLCAVALGAAIDHFLPQAHTLPEAVRLLRGR